MTINALDPIKAGALAIGPNRQGFTYREARREPPSPTGRLGPKVCPICGYAIRYVDTPVRNTYCSVMCWQWALEIRFFGLFDTWPCPIRVGAHEEHCRDRALAAARREMGLPEYDDSDADGDLAEHISDLHDAEAIYVG